MHPIQTFRQKSYLGKRKQDDEAAVEDFDGQPGRAREQRVECKHQKRVGETQARGKNKVFNYGAVIFVQDKARRMRIAKAT